MSLIHVVPRIKPDVSGDLLSINGSTINLNLHSSTKSFTFPTVLHNCSQEDVYLKTAAPLIPSLFDGLNCSVLAYGHTGSGKTYTMIGDPLCHQLRGIIPRALRHIFEEIEMREDFNFIVRVGFLEIYNNKLRDLLKRKIWTNQPKLYDTPDGICVKPQTFEAVSNEEHALQILLNGVSKRKTATTSLNQDSSRSHAVVTIELLNSETKCSSKLHLVDLAGSESFKNSNSSRNSAQETVKINQSLLAFHNVVDQLEGNSKSKLNHISFRDSKLTLLLKSSLLNSKTAVIVTVSANHLKNIEQSLSFASRVARLETVVTSNSNIDLKDDEIRKLRRLLTEAKIQSSNFNRDSTNVPPIKCPRLSDDDLDLDDSDDDAVESDTENVLANENLQLKSTVRILNSKIEMLESEVNRLNQIIDLQQVRSPNKRERVNKRSDKFVVQPITDSVVPHYEFSGEPLVMTNHNRLISVFDDDDKDEFFISSASNSNLKFFYQDGRPWGWNHHSPIRGVNADYFISDKCLLVFKPDPKTFIHEVEVLAENEAYLESLHGLDGIVRLFLKETKTFKIIYDGHFVVKCTGDAKVGFFFLTQDGRIINVDGQEVFPEFEEIVVDVYFSTTCFVILTNKLYVYAAGHSNYGELGLGGISHSPTPTRVRLPAIKSIHSSGCYSFALAVDGSLFAWGHNDEGQFGLGNERKGVFVEPVRIPHSFGGNSSRRRKTVVDFFCERATSALLMSDGSEYCSGRFFDFPFSRKL
ncbi:hypothetical protein GEMRC1_001107 [Eukaryota sp. GEM-RC1]